MWEVIFEFPRRSNLIVRDCCVDKLRNRRLHYRCMRDLTTLSGPWDWSPSRKRTERPINDQMPSIVRLVVSNLAYIEKKDLPSAMVDRVVRAAAFQNPEFYRAQAMHLSTYGKPRVISCGELFPEHIGLPRGCIEEVTNLFKSHSVKVEIQDERSAGRKIDVFFHGELRAGQKDVIARMLAHENGVLCAPTAFGKTVVAASVMSARGVNTLILVHQRQLMDQWRERLAVYLALPTKDIGQVGGGKDKRTFRRWWKSQDRVDHIAYIGAANNLAAVIVFVREGLGSATRLGARGTQRLISRDSLSNQSVSRTRWPPSEKIPSGVCDLPPVRVRPVPSPAAL